jgi:hypothetical protein
MQLTGIDISALNPQAVQYINKLENEIEMLRLQIDANRRGNSD